MFALIYLYANAALYLLFAAWCALKPQSTANSIGYTALSTGGVSEYITVYGGLQLGLAVWFAILAYKPELRFWGIVFSLALYVPIVAARWISIANSGGVPRMTLMTAALETVLLALAIVAWFVERRT